MSRLAFLIAALVLLLLAPYCPSSAADTDDAKSSLQLDDTPLPLVPKTARGEAEQDRLAAAAFFAHGRMLFLRQEHADALRRYQRAWRYDPSASRVLDEILQLSLGLKRNGEFMRYAVIRGETDPQDPMTLRRLAAFLTEDQQYERALGLYEKSLELNQGAEADGAVIVVRQQMGRLYFVTEQSEKAADQFAIVVQALDDPKKFGLNDELLKSVIGEADKTYQLFAEVFLDAGRLVDAEAMFKKANEAKEDKAIFAFNMARVLEKRDKIDESLASLNGYLEAGNDAARIEPYELLARLLEKKLGDKDQAKAEVRKQTKALYEQKPNPSLGVFVAGQARDAQDFELAVKIYTGLNDDKVSLDSLQGLITVYRLQNDIDKLLTALGNAILNTGTLDLLGEAATAVSGNAELMTKLVERAREQANGDGKSLAEGVALALGQLSVQAKRFDDADALYELALDHPKPEKRQVLLTWGLDMFMAEQNDRAARVFQRGVDDKDLSKNSPDFHFYLAGALEMGGKTDEAIETAKEAIRIEPKSVRLQGRIPWILYHAKRYEDAEREYLAMLKEIDNDYTSPDVRDTVRSARLVLSNICVLQGRLVESIEWLEQVLDEFPEDIGAKNDLGYLWADQGQHLHRALAMIQTAVEAEPDNEAYRDSLGWAFYRLGRFEEAVQELEKAAAAEDPDGVILDHLADALHQTKQTQRAVEFWKRAVESFQKQNDTNMLEKTKKKIEQHSAE